MQDVSAISNLKLRGSWGKAGNDNIGNYSYGANTLTSNMYYVFDNQLVTGTTPNGVANPEFEMGNNYHDEYRFRFWIIK